VQTFSRTEYSHGHWIDPLFIVSKVACGISLFDNNQNAIYLAPPNPRFLKLSSDMDWLLWRMPFTDLPELHLDPRDVSTRALCIPDLRTANGILQPYQWDNSTARFQKKQLSMICPIFMPQKLMKFPHAPSPAIHKSQSFT
jgi:hypothetical protein